VQVAIAGGYGGGGFLPLLLATALGSACRRDTLLAPRSYPFCSDWIWAKEGDIIIDLLVAADTMICFQRVRILIRISPCSNLYQIVSTLQSVESSQELFFLGCYG
jgi:hypothetical protein